MVLSMTKEGHKVDYGTYSDGTPRQKGKYECRRHPVSRGYNFMYDRIWCEHCVNYMKHVGAEDFEGDWC